MVLLMNLSAVLSAQIWPPMSRCLCLCLVDASLPLFGLEAFLSSAGSTSPSDH
jgi:hypothetical protein